MVSDVEKKEKSSLSRIVMFYDDNSFEEYLPEVKFNVSEFIEIQYIIYSNVNHLTPQQINLFLFISIYFYYFIFLFISISPKPD